MTANSVTASGAVMALAEVTGEDEPRGSGGVHLSARLEDARLIIEGKFLAAGDILSRSVKGTESLIASLDTLAATLDTQTVGATTSELKQTAAVLSGLPASHKGRMAVIADLNRCRDSFAERISDMRRSLTYMQAFTVNIKIVSGGIGDADGEFSIFAQDIANCIAQGIEKLKRIEVDLAALRAKLDTADGQGTELWHKIDNLLPPLRQALENSADAMEGHYRKVAATVGGVSVLARDIRKNAARILMALQIGDSTRQRLEHVQAALTAANDAEAKLSQADREKVATFVYALLSAQLSGAHADFDREVQEIDRSMVAMAASARELLKLHDMAFGGGDSGHGFLHELVARIEEAEELVARIDEADRQARQTGQETVQSAQALLVRVEEIQLLKNDVQYMALNTTLKCCQIGEVGRPLSVIAIALRDHGTEVDVAAEQGLADLNRLTKTAGDGQSEESSCKSASDALALAAQRVRTARDKTEADIAAIAAKGDEVLRLLEESNQRLRFRQDIGEAMDVGISALNDLCGTLEPCTDDIAVALDETMTAIAHRYAMVQERDIHRAFAEQWGLGAATEAKEDDFEDLLF